MRDRGLAMLAVFGWCAVESAAAQELCTVSGRQVDVARVTVRVPGEPAIRLSIRGDIEATFAGLGTGTRVRGTSPLAFSGVVDVAELDLDLAEPVSLASGALRLESGLAFRFARPRDGASGVVVDLTREDLVIRGIELPCGALIVRPSSWRGAFAAGVEGRPPYGHPSAPCDVVGNTQAVEAWEAGRAARLTAPTDAPGASTETARARRPSLLVRRAPEGPVVLRLERVRPEFRLEVLGHAGRFTEVRRAWPDGTVLRGWVATAALDARSSGLSARLGTLRHGAGCGTGGVPGGYVGPARVRAEATVHSRVGGPPWGRFVVPMPLRIEARDGSPWVRALEIEGVAFDACEPPAWILRTDVELGVWDGPGVTVRADGANLVVERLEVGSPLDTHGLRQGDVIQLDSASVVQSIDGLRDVPATGARLSILRAGITHSVEIPPRPECAAFHGRPSVCCSWSASAPEG